MEEWWIDAFSEEMESFWFGPDERASAEEEVAHLVNWLELRSGDRVLDIPCGVGRHAAYLMAWGLDVVGLDQSSQFLRTASEKAGDGHGFVRGDMRTLPFATDSFDAVLNLSSSFGYFEDLENELFLSEMARVLRPGGALVIEGANRDGVVARQFPEQREKRPGGGFVLQSFRMDPVLGTWNHDILLTDAKGGEVRRATVTMRIYHPTEMYTLLSHAGLIPVAFQEGYSGAPIGPQSLFMSLLARKGVG